MNILKKLFGSRAGKIEDKKQTFPNIVAAKVLHWEKHPNADRLRVVKLDLGASAEGGSNRVVEPVVCGASNFDNGDVVALALPGASIPQNIHSDTHEPFVLGKAKIRGVESQGMICAAFELGLEKEPGAGIMILKPDTKLGSEFTPEMIK